MIHSVHNAITVHIITLLCVITIITASTITTTTATTTQTSSLTVYEKQLILNYHNNIRANVIPLPATKIIEITWSSVLEEYAVGWSGECVYDKSDAFYWRIYGENIAFGKNLNITEAMNTWAEESRYYDINLRTCFSDVPNFDTPNAKNSTSDCSAYLQMVWAKTLQIGCGISVCNNNTESLFVCSYSPRGVFAGVAPYKIALYVNNNTTKTENYTSDFGIADYAGSSTKRSVRERREITGPASGTIDWRYYGIVSSMKNQATCGSCWAFSAASIVESAWAKQTGLIYDLSPQQNLDCSPGNTCNGGWPLTSLEYTKNKGLNKLSTYPYVGYQQVGCKYSSADNTTTISSYGTIYVTSYLDVVAALRKYGPIAVAVYADWSWYSYSSGVLSGKPTTVNHMVTAVGWDESRQAFLIKNQWGAGWGMNGYAYISASAPCGILLYGVIWAQSTAPATAPLYVGFGLQDSTNGYMLDAYGQFHPYNSPSQLTWVVYPEWYGQQVIQGVAFRPDRYSGYILDAYGGVYPYGGAPSVKYTYKTGLKIARDIAIRSDGISGYVLDGYGSITPFGNASAVVTTAYWPGWDIARSIVLRSDGKSGYVLDGYGSLHPFGGAPYYFISAYWAGQDTARKVVLRNDNSGYVLNKYGQLYPFGTKTPTVTGNGPYWSDDQARAVSLRNDGKGGYVMSKYGEVKTFQF